MRVRALDATHDWTFGKGVNDYKRDLAAVIQNINTRLNSYLGDCFFDLGAGIDWFNFIGSKDQLGLNLAISAIILNTPEVTGLMQMSLTLNAARNFEVQYVVQTTYSTSAASFVLDNTVGA
jgi:hypothetical protein